jgi:hypothetical protein
MLRRSHALLALATMACRAPTEIVIELSTDVPCATVASNHVSIRLGPAGSPLTAANAATAIEADSCNGGTIGSLVAIPSGTSSELVGIAAVLGVTEPTSACDVDAGGCILAKRSLRYDQGVPLHLPIRLDAICLGRACAPNETCQNGACVPDDVPSCPGGVCPQPGPDAGACPPAPLAPSMPEPTLAWHFDEGQGTVTHEAANAVAPATVPATAWTTGPSDCGTALHLDGTFAVVLGDHAALQASAGVTITYWLRGGVGNALARHTSNTGFDTVGGCIELYDPVNGTDTLCPLALPTDGAWHQIALSIKGNGSQPATVHMRIDTADTVITGAAAYVPAQGVPLEIVQSFEGDIDDVLVYDQPL